jgi:predicted O-linked N-acetylglucosamine transferase (SPINDLY family)
VIDSPGIGRDAVSNYLIHSNRVPGLDPAALAQRHRRLVAAHWPAPEAVAWPNIAVLERRLRVGYVSGDLRRHSVAAFAESAFEHRDRSAIEVRVYCTSADADDITDRFRVHSDGWTSCVGLPDDAVLSRIRADGVDILVDLAGHSAWNGLHWFARRAAPVQATWLGYPTTTGVSGMDYRITDSVVDPDGAEAFSTERLVRLPWSYYCYRPFEAAPPVTEPPSLSSGHITFASFNDGAKITDATCALWAAVLAAVPGSRLLVKASALRDPAAREHLHGDFAARGIARDRIELVGWTETTAEHLALYGRADIALDTFPYNGGTTTCEALWMGVPVVTLCGSTHAARMGASLLRAAHCETFVARTVHEFTGIATALAGDPARLLQLRTGMRARLRAAPLLDGARFARDLEAAYRAMWRSWCEEGGEGGPGTTAGRLA